jgi:hypothetical protein
VLVAEIVEGADGSKLEEAKLLLLVAGCVSEVSLKGISSKMLTA